MRQEGGWNDEREAAAKRLWLEGKSYTEIADAIGGGISRGAVGGKINRMGLGGRVQAPLPPKRPTVAAVVKLKPPPAPEPRRDFSKPPTAIPVTPAPADIASRPFLANLPRHGCKWPIGEDTGADQRFCGDPRAGDDEPYCQVHKARAFGRPATALRSLEKEARRYA